MTPIELLKSTQRAVASQEMIDMHEALKSFRGKQKTLQAHMKTEQDTLTNLESRQRLQEADVERLREREEIVKRVDMLQLARPSVHYHVAKDKFEESKTARKQMQREYTQLQEEVEPALRALKAKELYHKKVNEVVKERRSAISSAERVADDIDQAFKKLNDEHTAIDKAKENEKTKMKEKKQSQLKLEGRLRELRIQLNHKPQEVDTAAYNEKMVFCPRSCLTYDSNRNLASKTTRGRRSEKSSSGSATYTR